MREQLFLEGDRLGPATPQRARNPSRSRTGEKRIDTAAVRHEPRRARPLRQQQRPHAGLRRLNTRVYI